MKVVAVANKVEQGIKDRRATGRFVITIDAKDGGIGNVKAYATEKNPKDEAMLMSCSGNEFLKEIPIDKM